MRCVPDAVSRLFPEIDLSLFPARDVGYGLGDIQRMLPNEYSIWPIYVNHLKVLNFDLLKQLPKTENRIPMFLFTEKHCIYAIWGRSEIEIFDTYETGVFDAEYYFNNRKIKQVCCIVRYSDYNLLTLKF
jgi:hypothetical protein